ncbi:hypothetical protein H0E87_008003 [Populus deltoides]|uniref:FHA domain-containing protein n=1 Tax=Populus deltoides TaxID=3696 RepID=A0A8T2YYR0_POPDE|nr:hypothetical protein H0E87_008003 [Populus deltoides]
MSTMLWCTHCAIKCQTLREGDFLSCSMCGKVLSMLTWHKKLNIRNPRSKRTKRRIRNNVQVADDESSVNVDDGLLDTAKRPSVKVNKDSGSPKDFFSNLQGVGIKAKKQRGLGFVHASGAESTLTSVEERRLLEPVGDGDSRHIGFKVKMPDAFEIASSEVTVGRLPEKADMVIPVATVSALHARIQKKGGTLVVTDLDSTNGTFIDEKRLRPGLLELLSVYRLEVVSHLDVCPNGAVKILRNDLKTLLVGDTHLAMFLVSKLATVEAPSKPEESQDK